MINVHESCNHNSLNRYTPALENYTCDQEYEDVGYRTSIWYVHSFHWFHSGVLFLNGKKRVHRECGFCYLLSKMKVKSVIIS